VSWRASDIPRPDSTRLVCTEQPFGMRNTERVTVTLPLEQAQQLRRLAGEGETASISAYVSKAVRAQLDKDAALERLRRLYAERGVTLRPEHHAWARDLLGLEGTDPQVHAS
jgi:Arc/MetJ-type ribon-helix-helix transcriptional regulator